MPSPFPGMDPYLEDPQVWPDFHDALASEIRKALNADLPAPYYARLEMRPEVGIVDEGVRQRIVPDVAVVRHRPMPMREQAAVAVLDPPETRVSRSYEIAVPTDPIRHHFVEIRDPTRGHQLVTLIEILSPSNKRPGPDQLAYRRKQDEVLCSDVNLIELDLLRAGDRLRPRRELELWLEQHEPAASYVVWINRSWSRDRHEAFPIALSDRLPIVPTRGG
mgnify:FL=1